ncbi:MAG: right-handed parallel beta-helix repeat-containing protein [Verrucomicrobia bacterium]|nr:right-handed parallel beta-helix repeat-containing protein [Verrucomicrobiota bacterium]
MLLLFRACLVGVFVGVWFASAQSIWVVAPTGGPVGPGENTSLTEALAAFRSTRVKGSIDPAVIELRGGTHFLPETLVLGPRDSGLILRARQGETPIVSGARRLERWSPVSGQPGVWETQVLDVRNGRWDLRQLYLDGHRQRRARTPNDGFFRATGRLGTNSPIVLPFRAGDLSTNWARPGVELVMLMKWTDLRVPLKAVDVEKLEVTIPGGPRPYWMDESDARYWVENSLEGLDQEGEWAVEPASGVVRWRAPIGVDPNLRRVTAARLLELVRVSGEEGNPVRQLRFEGITWAESDYRVPPDGLISPQAAAPIGGAWKAEFAVNCRVESCRFVNLGGYGLELARGCQNWIVQGNEFRELGAGGIRLGEPGEANPPSQRANHGHQVTDNRLLGLGRIFAPAVGVIVFHSGSNRIAFNHISDLYYTGISVGWNWGYQETACRANVIENNLVEHVGQGRLSDMGGIYTLGPQPGTVIRNNVFRDIVSYGYGGWGLYTDEGSTGILLENNVATGCKSAGFHQHYGRDNVVRFNLLAFNQEHELMRTREEPHRSFWFTNNVVIWDSGDLLGSNWGGTPEQFLLDHNLYFDTRLGGDFAQYRFGKDSWRQWQARGQDRHSRLADPQLLDPKRPELGFRSGSPAEQVGFRPERLLPLGPRPAAERKP